MYSMNNLKGITELNNRYFVLRHGESRANTKQIIVSDPKNGLFDFGLTEKGMIEVRDSVSGTIDLDENTIIYSSDFKRAKETAEIAQAILKINDINFTELLRERFFGNFEGMDDRNYDIVFKNDEIDPHNKIEKVESVNDVLDRATKFVVGLEKQFQGEKILLVSHGDTLKILEAGFLDTTREDVESLKTGQTRELKIK